MRSSKSASVFAGVRLLGVHSDQDGRPARCAMAHV